MQITISVCYQGEFLIFSCFPTVWIVEFGKWDIKRILDKGGKTQEEFYKYVDQWTYTILNSLGLKATPEEPVKECIVIFDMEGYSLEQLNSSKGKKTAYSTS